MAKKRFYGFEVEVLNDKTKLGLSIPRYVMHDEGAEPDVAGAITRRNGVGVGGGRCERQLDENGEVEAIVQQLSLVKHVKNYIFQPVAEIFVKTYVEKK